MFSQFKQFQGGSQEHYVDSNRNVAYSDHQDQSCSMNVFVSAQVLGGMIDICHLYYCRLSIQIFSRYLISANKIGAIPRISTTEATFESHIIDSTIFQTNSFDFLSEFAQLISCSTCSAYSDELSRESEKMSQQNKRKILSSSQLNQS